MRKATLNYVINTSNGSKVLPLDSASLYYIDSYTSQYKNQHDLIINHPDKDKILNFIHSNNGEDGKLKISYTMDLESKKNLVPLYSNMQGIVIEDDLLNDKISETEKARKLLFNSKSQLFARIVSMSNSLKPTFSYQISISYQEYLNAKKNNLIVYKKDDSYYIEFSELLKYRANNKKLGQLRAVYEDMLVEWKHNMESLDSEELYYYSRQIKILINDYLQVIARGMSITLFKIYNKSKSTFKKNCFIRYKSPYKRIISRN